MLAWMECADGRQTARATPFRQGKHLIEIGGWFEIAFGIRFTISYCPAEGSRVELGIADTLGGAHVLAEEHYLALRAKAAAQAAPPSLPDGDVSAATARAVRALDEAQLPPCDECLRPAAPCMTRCLRSLLAAIERGEASVSEIAGV